MGNPFRGAKFRELQAEWERKLAASGLENVERRDGSIVYGGNALRRGVRRALRSGRGDYYRRAGQWLHDRTFKTRTQRRVWELHCEGMPHRDIGRALGPMRMHQPRRVLEVIQRERAAMVTYYAQLPVEAEAPTLHQQHLEAEGFGPSFDFDDHMAGPGDPMRRIHRAMERAGATRVGSGDRMVRVLRTRKAHFE